MIDFELPTSVEVGGAEYEVRSDYRAILDICVALSDPNLDGREKTVVLIQIFYPGFDDIPAEHYEEAIKKCFWFINCGEEEEIRKVPELVDWEQDFRYIVAPINRVIGQEIRSVSYMHWWTFISAYYEIGGDCLFSQIVRIRNLLAKGKKLEKDDREWLRQNSHLVRFKKKYSTAEDELLKQWGGG